MEIVDSATRDAKNADGKLCEGVLTGSEHTNESACGSTSARRN